MSRIPAGTLLVLAATLSTNGAFALDETFPESIVATDAQTFSWTTAADVEYVRGDLGAVSSYATNDRGSLIGATSLFDPSLPAPGSGFYYLVRALESTHPGSSWQTTLGAEPERDTSLVAVPCAIGPGLAGLRVRATTVNVPGLPTFDARSVSAVDGDALGPMLTVNAGETCNLTVTNELDAGTTQISCPFHANDYHCADTTSLYAHSLANSGSWGGTVVGPGESVVYSFPVPTGAPPGIHLYRAGYHGSAALQTGGGIAGVVELINDGFALPADVAALYDAPLLPPLLLQHVFLGAGDSGSGALVMSSHNDVSAAYGSEQTVPVNQNPGGNVQTVIVNGVLQPTFDVHFEDATLLRFASASTARIIELELVDPGASCTMELLARDGIFQTVPYPTVNSIVLLPGSRADVAIQCDAMRADDTIVFRAIPDAANDPTLGTINRHSQAVVMSLNLVSGTGSGVPLPTSQVTLPEPFDSLETATVAIPFDGSGASVPEVVPGPGNGGPGTFGLNGVSFPGYAEPEATRYALITCVGEAYEITVGRSALSSPIWPMSFPFHVQTQASDASSGIVYRQGEWRDVVPSSRVTVRFKPTRPGEFPIGTTYLQQQDRGALGLMRVCGRNETTGICSPCAAP